jgi:hypothetical protein
VTSGAFKAFFERYFSAGGPGEAAGADLASIDWAAWFFAPGMPPVAPVFDRSLAQPSLDLSAEWAFGARGVGAAAGTARAQPPPQPPHCKERERAREEERERAREEEREREGERERE